MVALAPPPYVLADTLCCLGLGFFLAVCYDMSRFVFGGSRPVCFVLDLTVFACAAVLLHSFAAGKCPPVGLTGTSFPLLLSWAPRGTGANTSNPRTLFLLVLPFPAPLDLASRVLSYFAISWLNNLETQS